MDESGVRGDEGFLPNSIEGEASNLALAALKKSNNKKLHNLVSHQITKEVNHESTDTDDIWIKDTEEGNNQKKLNQVMKEAGLSPRANNKGKKSRIKVEKPTRTSSRRGGKASIQ